MEKQSLRITSLFRCFFRFQAIAFLCLLAGIVSSAASFLFPEKSCLLCQCQRMGYYLAAIIACLLTYCFRRFLLYSLRASFIFILLAAAVQGFIHIGALPDVCARHHLRFLTYAQYIESIQNTRSCSDILTLWRLPLYLYSGALALLLLTVTFSKKINLYPGANNETHPNTK